ncbi:MAG: molybdopterin-synthase adenylyltransferase MoeB [Alphaproteobacteria bacterium]|nr:molybdopterin-synthase adenylyltransferase MoeB [Alphaproteobacteria bacterium]
MTLSEEQIERYARHIHLKEVGTEGQEKLLAAKVLVIGAGGLGSPLIQYLTAAGVGTIGVVDDDTVDMSNLQRQVLHTTAHVGSAKVDSAMDGARAINPGVDIVPHRERLTSDNARDLIHDYDVVADGSDNFETRFLINDACFFEKKTLVSAAVLRFDGQLSTYRPHTGSPCYRCLYPEPPPPDDVWTCEQAGILGAVAGVMGSLQATEVLKEIMGIGEGMAGRLLIYDALDLSTRMVKVKPDPGCALCSDQATITTVTT